MNEYLFYPGCSMESSAQAYDESLEAVYKKLGFEPEGDQGLELLWCD